MYLNRNFTYCIDSGDKNLIAESSSSWRLPGSEEPRVPTDAESTFDDDGEFDGIGIA